jgi:CO/xanthine dehydrogenase Mo-binding subunit
VAAADTSVVPDTGPTVASRTTMVVGSLVKKACETLLEKLRSLLARDPECGPGAVTYRGGIFHDRRGEKIDTFASACKKYLESGAADTIEETFSLPPGHTWDEQAMRGDAYPCFSWGADVIEVEVDMDTFQVTPLRATMVFDAGRTINPQAAVGQFEGGTLQSIGWGGIEAMKYDEGRLLCDRLSTYVIPTASDCPEYHTEILEIPYSHGPFGAKGIGELPYDGAAAALASAIENATGIRVTEIPATPEILLEAYMKTARPADPCSAWVPRPYNRRGARRPRRA